MADRHHATGTAPRYWKIAPGRGARAFEDWRTGGYIGIAWNELGDVSGLDRAGFEQHFDEIASQYPGWTLSGVGQVWTLAHEIKPGDRVVANEGTRRVLGIGTVTGAYFYVPDASFSHRLPVRWDDVTPRAVEEGGWRSTLIELNEDKFEAIVETPPSSHEFAAGSLAEPFAAVFRDEDEARWAFDLLRKTMMRLGASGPDDERFTLSLRRVTGGQQLQLNMGNWAVLHFRHMPQGTCEVALVLLTAELSSLPVDDAGKFSQPDAESQVSLALLSLYDLRTSGDRILSSFYRTLDVVERHFGSWSRSPFRRAHQAGLFRLLFDPERLADALANGIAVDQGGESEADEGDVVTEPPREGSERYFTERTFELLAGLHETPRKEYYDSHRDTFRTDLISPFRDLFADLAKRLSPSAVSLLETEKRLLATVLKNDYGQGGANDFYWGAFYQKGLTRTTSPQLSVWIDARLVSVGFDIGDRGSEARDRFRRNVASQRMALIEVLDLFLSESGLHYGTEEQSFADLETWLAQPGLETRACANLPRDQVLAMSRDQLAEHVAEVFRLLYPFVILATSDDPLAEIRAYVGSVAGPAAAPRLIQPAYPLEQVAADTGFAEGELACWLRALERKKQAILYGPPGTGKTYLARKLARHLVGGSDGLVDLVQFHPAYAYEDFMQGIRPQSRDGVLDYPVVPGRFVRFCAEARERSGPCVLIIDEINRANLARVFGELMYLLEYRDEDVPLAVDGTPFRIPGNVRLIGTMNTADRSIALVDHALRRRFAFIELGPQYDILERRLAGEAGVQPEGLVRVLRRINRAIDDRNYALGISFFLVDGLAQQIEDIWRMEIQPYLDEYFFDRPGEAQRFGWDEVCKEIIGA